MMQFAHDSVNMNHHVMFDFEAGPSTSTSMATSAGPSAQPKKKRQKFFRSRTACFPCRAKKAKCGGQPPQACSNCVEAGQSCEWPDKDGRSMRAKGQKRKKVDKDAGGDADEGLDGHDEEDGDDGAEEYDYAEQEGEGAIKNEFQHAPPTVTMTDGSTGLTPGWTPFFNDAVGMMAGPSTEPMHQMPSSMPPPAQTYLPPTGISPMTEFDIAQFVSAITAQLPQVQDSSPQGSVHTGPSPNGRTDPHHQRHTPKNAGEEGKIVKLTWWRPHGQTAIAPGLKQYTLKIRVETPQETWRKDPHNNPSVNTGYAPEEVITADGMPSTPIMLDLLAVFMTHFGSQFPCIDRRDMEAKIHARTGSSFLLNCIAGLAARFSMHPAIALPSLQPWEYGNVFIARAKSMLGSMLAVPSRETVIAFILLAHCGFANDSESEVWMMTGLAVRMSYELGLQINIPESSNTTSEERRLNMLTFWSVLLMDYALAFGVGRQTAIRPNDITQALPTEADVRHADSASAPRSPFPFAAKMMKSYGPLINMLNIGDPEEASSVENDIQQARAQAMAVYNQLPEDMLWNVANFQAHNRANQGSIFLHTHLWMHTILASRYLTDPTVVRKDRKNNTGTASGHATPHTMTVNNLWRNSARTIGDILVLSDIINPFTYIALPFVNQAFYVAGSCYVKEIEQHDAFISLQAPSQPDPSSTERNHKQNELSRALLASVAKTNISTLQQGLAKQTIYWSGAAWVSGALEQRIEGMREVDLVNVTERLNSFVRLPDAGLVGGTPDSSGPATGGSAGGGTAAHGVGSGVPSTRHMSVQQSDMGYSIPSDPSFSFGDTDFTNWPFDLTDPSVITQNLTTQAIQLPPSMSLDWLNGA